MQFITQGFLNITWWDATLLMLGLTHLTILTVTLYLHRSCAHKAVDFPLPIQYAFRLWSWISTGMTARKWASVHRKHHAKCETPQDPHSPQHLGIIKVLFNGADLYRREAKNPETIEKYGRGTPHDNLEVFMEKYQSLGMIAMFLAEVLMFGGAKAIFIIAFQLCWIPFWAAGVINGLGHYTGYRNFDTSDASTNLSPIGFIIGGEELHNNHHAFPSSAKLSIKPWEFDWGWGVLVAMSTLGLAKIRRINPRLNAAKSLTHQSPEITSDTLTAVITCRLLALREAKHAILPEISAYLRSLSNPTLISKKKFTQWFFFGRTESMNEKERQTCEQLLRLNEKLASMRQYVKELMETWQSAHGSANETLTYFRKWCQSAENSGLTPIQSLAKKLMHYELAVTTYNGQLTPI